VGAEAGWVEIAAGSPEVPTLREAYRLAMRRVAASVTVITAGYADRLHGMTATAVTSVSADPPTLLIVVNRSAKSHEFVSRSGRFAVNILDESQVEVARRFALDVAEKFAGLAYTLDAEGRPMIDGAVASFACISTATLEVATHTVFVGRVERATCRDGQPLVYFDGRYAKVGGPS
jgi:flavin reductase (DIM6/NTAB) family NADH-FMN oxidoreductase RutF